MATILLVDDVQLFIELEKSFLQDAGYTVVTASSGEEALAILPQINPALLLLDLYMPGIDGDEVCRRMRSEDRWKTLPVIMVTAAGKEAEIRKCLDAGCDDYVTKPVQKKLLIEKVKRLLGAVKARTEERKPLTFQVQIRGEGQQLIATARDLSRNGIFLNGPASMAPGTVVELKLSPSEGRDVVLMGKVKRIQDGPDGGMGIYFIRPEGMGTKELDQMLRETADAGLTAELSEPSEALQTQLGSMEMQNSRLREENASLRQRIREMENENREFAERIVHTEEVNNNLTNLYIASSRLHSVLNRIEVIEIIQEVAINLVGAEKFALALYDKESESYRFEAGEGVTPEEFPTVETGSGLLGKVIADGEPYFQEGPVAAGSDDLQTPLAAIPLTIHDSCIGLLAIYRLFTQKDRFEEVDFQLFNMMAEHAATAIFSSNLYEASERKRQTYQGFMELLLK
ncbi:response regulator [Trichloromonas sp.]|uniref:response regulator n=1 Tax=Trichloromonas sp. TaxID=3069249 RepID=UPI003D816331